MMTDDELQKAGNLLWEAFRLRRRATEAYLAAVEFIVPLVDGDADCIKNARRSLVQVEHFTSQAAASMRDGNYEQLANTFRDAKTTEGWG